MRRALLSRNPFRAALFPLFLLGAAPSARAVSPPAQIPNFALLDSRGSYFELARRSDAKAVVIISHMIGCPILRRFAPELKELKEKFGPLGIQFFFLNPVDGQAEIAEEAADFSSGIPVLIDDAQEVSRLLGFTRTTEIAVLAPSSGKILYRGPIGDDFGYESQKVNAKHLLFDALSAVTKGEAVPAGSGNAYGCALTLDEPRAVSYRRQVAPLLLKKCLPCHSAEGGMPPTNWSSHAKIAAWSAMIREVLLNGRMPPWSADPHFGTFRNDFSLKGEEKRVLYAWLDAGAPYEKGIDPVALAGQLRAPRKWALGKPDMELRLPSEQVIPARGRLGYRYLPLLGPLDKDLWIRAVQIRSDNRNVVHHAVLRALARPVEEYPSQTGGAGMIFADPAESMIHVTGKFGEAAEYPSGVARRIPKGSWLYLEIHYQPSGKEEVDRTDVGLYLYRKKKPPRELKAMFLGKTELEIPAHRSRVIYADVRSLPRPIKLWGLFAHMHYRGVSASMELLSPDGGKETLLSLPKYDFNWHRYYFFQRAKEIPEGFSIRFSATFDNSDQNPFNPDSSQLVKWGGYDTDEMMTGLAFYTEH